MQQQQQQQQPRKYLSLDRRRGTLGGSSDQRSPWGLQSLVASPKKSVRIGLVVIVAAVAAIVVFMVIIAGQSPTSDTDHPRRFFLKVPGSNGVQDKANPFDESLRRGDGSVPSSGAQDEGEDGGADALDHGHYRRHVYHPGFDLEAWKALLHPNKRGAATSTFEAAGEGANSAGRNEEQKRQKRRISDALMELHRQKQEEMVRAVKERLNDHKLEATNLFHREQHEGHRGHERP